MKRKYCFTIKIILSVCFVTNLFLIDAVNAQLKEVKPLQVGDQVPDVVLKHIMNYKKKTAKLSDFKGKLIILDFWNRYCDVCIRTFPKMEKLQEMFGDRIQIILVTADPPEVVEQLAKTVKNVRNVKLPIVVSEKELHDYFPSWLGYPWYAIIDPSNKMVACTSLPFMTEETIQTVLDGKPLNKNINIDQEYGMDVKMPFLVDGGGKHWDKVQYYSMIMKPLTGNYKSGFGTPLYHPVTKEQIEGGISLHVKPMIYLYLYAYGDGYMIVEDDNPQRYFLPEDGDYRYNKDFKMNQCFNYEQIVPKGKEHLARQFMEADLEKYFGFTGMWEERTLPCHILYRLDSIDRLSSKYTFESIGALTRDQKDSLSRIMNRPFNPISDIMKWMAGGSLKARIYKAPIMLNGTGFGDDKAVGVHFTADVFDLDRLRTEIARFGLGIKVENRPVKCLVLKKNQFWQYSHDSQAKID